MDANDEPLMGATVKVPDTPNITVTDLDGNFTIKVPKGGIVEISYIGLHTEIIKDFNGMVYAVRGNCDFSGKYPEERLIEINGKRIFICHGHRYNVKYGYNSIYYKGKELGADIVLFGHSHLPIVEEYDELILMNPGSISHGMGRINQTLGYIDLTDSGNAIAYIKEL